MRRLLTAVLITAALTSGCASTRPAAVVSKSPAADIASASADMGHSPGIFSFAHPFNRRPDWVEANWAQDHPVLFVGVVVPTAVLAAVLCLMAASAPGG